jgi:hypothetical protein
MLCGSETHHLPMRRVRQTLWLHAVHWQNGVRVIRIFIGIDGYKSKTPVQYPTQPTFGKYSETALRRIDYCFYAAGRVRSSGPLHARG